MPVNDVIRFYGPAPAVDVEPGKVWLVGAGPGDPDLLTLKAMRIIEQADIILFDNLVSQAIRDLFPSATPAIYVGKIKDAHSIPQHELNELLVEKAQRGLNVCRIKGGDAFVFGRGGEEMLRLKEAGISVELVPGITAAAGCTSYAGIPLTHRGVSQGCTFVTGHGEQSLDVNWRSLAHLNHTLVFYMGLTKAQFIQDSLIDAGMNTSTPVALIENGCCPSQRLLRGSIDELAQIIAREKVKSPALIVVGDVVNLADKLEWFSTMAMEQNSKQEITKLLA